MKTAIIIPALNEQESIRNVLEEIPAPYNQNVIVVDNGSMDLTPNLARGAGASVISAPERGYGAACLAGISLAKKEIDPDVYIFLDADYSDFPEDLTKIMEVLVQDAKDMVIGSRVSRAEAGALLPQARFGNWLATSLLWLRFGYRFSDLGPFRVITREALEQLQMCDRNFGWTMEMQIKALRLGLNVGEVPVRYRQRIGVSKITGTLKGTIAAGYKILWTLFRYSLPFYPGPKQQRVEYKVFDGAEIGSRVLGVEPAIRGKYQITEA